MEYEGLKYHTPNHKDPVRILNQKYKKEKKKETLCSKRIITLNVF